MKALPKILLALTGLAALSLAYPASVQAVPTTYQYIGNHFTDVSGRYTTSMFVTVMVTLAHPLHANMPPTQVFPTAFTFFDGVQTITNFDAHQPFFSFATDGAGHITGWQAVTSGNGPLSFIETALDGPHNVNDVGQISLKEHGFNTFSPGEWSGFVAVPDAGSTLSLMTLTLMALGLVARRFKRAAG